MKSFIKQLLREQFFKMERTFFKKFGETYNVGDIITGDKLDELSGGLVTDNSSNKYILTQQNLDVFDLSRQNLIELDPDYAEEEIWRLESIKDNFDKTPPIPEEGDGMHRIIAAKELGYKTILMWKRLDK